MLPGLTPSVATQGAGAGQGGWHPPHHAELPVQGGVRGGITGVLRELSVALPILHALWLWAAFYPECHKNSIFPGVLRAETVGKYDVMNTN